MKKNPLRKPLELTKDQRRRQVERHLAEVELGIRTADGSPLLHFSELKGYTVLEAVKIKPKYVTWLYHNAHCMTEEQRQWASIGLNIEYKPRPIKKEITDDQIKF